MAYHPDDMYLNDDSCGCNKPTKPNPGAKPYKLQTIPDDSNIRNNGTSSFGFMLLLVFNILQFITIIMLLNILIKKGL